MNIEDARRELNVARRWLRERNLERDAIIDAMFACYLAQEHILLLGPPGTGKSRIATDFAKVTGIPDEDRFGILLDRFTSKDEMFGPVKLSGLVERDEYGRKLRGLAASRFVFADEIFKASSAILNAMLTAINERLFDNDGARVQIPLEMVVGASNEMPEDESLGALWDRFIARFVVQEISAASMVTLLANRGTRATAPIVTPQAIVALREAAQSFIDAPPYGVVLAITHMRERKKLSARRAVKLRALIAGYVAMGLSIEDAITSTGCALWDDPAGIGDARALAIGGSQHYQQRKNDTPPWQAPAAAAPSAPPPTDLAAAAAAMASRAPLPPPRSAPPGNPDQQRAQWVQIFNQVQSANASTAGLLKVQIENLRQSGYRDGNELVKMKALSDGRVQATWEDLLSRLDGILGRPT